MKKLLNLEDRLILSILASAVFLALMVAVKKKCRSIDVSQLIKLVFPLSSWPTYLLPATTKKHTLAR